MKIMTFFVAILATILFTACGQSDPEKEYLKNIEASAAENEEFAGEDGDEQGELPANHPSLGRFMKEHHSRVEEANCPAVRAADRQWCWSQVYKGNMDELNLKQYRVSSRDPDRKGKLVKQYLDVFRADIAKCSDMKCRAIVTEKYLPFIDLVEYQAYEHDAEKDAIKTGDVSQYGQTCVRLKQTVTHVKVRDDQGSLLFSIPTDDGLNQYTVVGIGTESKKPLLVESTARSELDRWNGAIIGFVDEAAIEEVKEGALCEPIGHIYDRGIYQ